LEGFVDLPSGLRIVGFDTRVKHSVGGSRYTTSRIGAFMGQKMIADAKAMGGEPDTTNGYLANIGVSEFRARWNKYLPASMKGAEFLARYGGTNDPVTTVDPDETYMVRSRVEHPVYENARVRGFSALLEDARLNDVVEPLVRAGALMYSSHWSYGKRCGMGSKETDLVVRLVRRLGPERGFFGAKITGGGSGGTVAILCKSDTDAEVNLLAEAYTAQTGLYPHLFLATGPGAEEWGITVFTP
jgi:L-arabinokinase